MFERQKRQALIVYLYYNRDARRLEQFGDLLYHSRKMKYSIIYVNQEDSEQLVQKLLKMKFVKEVKLSLLTEIDSNFVGNLNN